MVYVFLGFVLLGVLGLCALSAAALSSDISRHEERQEVERHAHGD